jgi:predicted amino acid racemase
MLAGGASKLAESRLGNVRRLRQAGIEAEIMLLRLPAMSEAGEVVALTQVSLNSQVETVRALSRAASAQGVTHRVILMIETGDRREGVMPERALEAARGMVGLPNIELIGMGANTTCIGGVLPTRENTQVLVDAAEMVERRLGIHFQTISAGNSASLALLLRDEMPARANQLRIGGAIMIGEVDSTGDWPDALPHQDAFAVRAEVIEVEVKPSVPEGRLAPNAFGDTPQWPDLGPRRRAILALGRQDLQIESLIPKRPGVTILGASSDHLVLDVTEASPPVHTGEQMEFRPLYGAVATGMASKVAQQVICN